MKLYTEQQLETAIMTAYISTMHKPIEIEVVYYGLMNELTPIELPSDDEIQDESEKYYDNNAAKAHDYYFKLGAKWLREKIQGGQL